MHADLLPKENCLPPEAIDNCQLLFDVPVFLMLQLLQAGVVKQVRLLALLAFVSLYLKEYALANKNTSMFSISLSINSMPCCRMLSSISVPSS